jgi:hypothetical protein
MAEALEGWDLIAPRDRLLLGVTATPNRSDAIGLGCVFQSIVHSYRLRDAVRDKYLVPIVPWAVETQSSLDAVKLQHGDFNQKQLGHAVNNDVRNHLAVAAWQEYALGRPTLAFAVNVEHAHDLAACFVEQSVRAAAISGDTERVLRRQILDRFRTGDLDVVTNCMVLTEGTDLPMCSSILHAAPTMSATLYEQKTGRGLRTFEKKRDCVVIDLVDVTRKHSLMTAPVLYGLPPGLNAQGKILDTTADEWDQFIDKYPGADLQGRFTLAQLQAKAHTFDIWSIRPMGAFAQGTAMKWTRVGDERFRISYPWNEGSETLTIERDMLGKFDIVATFRPGTVHAGEPGVPRQRTLVVGVESGNEALLVAEAFMRAERSSVTKIMDVDAPWRTKPASERQKGRLRILRVPFNPDGLTMGHASQLIDAAEAKRGR